MGAYVANLAGQEHRGVGCDGPAQGCKNLFARDALVFGAATVHQNGKSMAGQQHGQQRCEQGQFARTVVAGDDQCGRCCRAFQQAQAGGGGIQKARHFIGCFALDAHGQAKSPDFQVGELVVQQLTHQIGGLCTVPRPSAIFATADFLEVRTDAHGKIVSHAGATLDT